jgi:hypothetical protein
MLDIGHKGTRRTPCPAVRGGTTQAAMTTPHPPPPLSPARTNATPKQQSFVGMSCARSSQHHDEKATCGHKDSGDCLMLDIEHKGRCGCPHARLCGCRGRCPHDARERNTETPIVQRSGMCAEQAASCEGARVRNIVGQGQGAGGFVVQGPNIVDPASPSQLGLFPRVPPSPAGPKGCTTGAGAHVRALQGQPNLVHHPAHLPLQGHRSVWVRRIVWACGDAAGSGSQLRKTH